MVTDADLASHMLISSELRRLYPGHNLILEETDHADAIPDTYIVADELDGTVIYTNGLPEWGISIAHVKNGIPVVGVLHQPTHKVTVAAWRKGGTWIGKKRVTLDGKQSLSECISLVELNRFLEDAHISWISRIWKNSLATRSLGSVIGSSLELLHAHAAIYLNCVGAKVWDFAAAVVAVNEAGGVATASDGNDLTWRRLPISVLLAANSQVAEEALSLRADFGDLMPK